MLPMPENSCPNLIDVEAHTDRELLIQIAHLTNQTCKDVAGIKDQLVQMNGSIRDTKRRVFDIEEAKRTDAAVQLALKEEREKQERELAAKCAEEERRAAAAEDKRTMKLPVAKMAVNIGVIITIIILGVIYGLSKLGGL
jgi:superfamily II RNA helicase